MMFTEIGTDSDVKCEKRHVVLFATKFIYKTRQMRNNFSAKMARSSVPSFYDTLKGSGANIADPITSAGAFRFHDLFAEIATPADHELLKNINGKFTTHVRCWCMPNLIELRAYKSEDEQQLIYSTDGYRGFVKRVDLGVKSFMQTKSVVGMHTALYAKLKDPVKDYEWIRYEPNKPQPLTSSDENGNFEDVCEFVRLLRDMCECFVALSHSFSCSKLMSPNFARKHHAIDPNMHWAKRDMYAALDPTGHLAVMYIIYCEMMGKK